MKTYFLDAIFNHYVDFKGRATRKQFWMFILWVVIISMGLGIITGILGIPLDTSTLIARLFGLVILLPTLSIASKRLRDAGLSPWLLLMLLVRLGLIIPILNIIFFVLYLIVLIVMAILCCMPSRN